MRPGLESNANVVTPDLADRRSKRLPGMGQGSLSACRAGPMRPADFGEGAYIDASGRSRFAVALGMSVWRAHEAKNVET